MNSHALLSVRDRWPSSILLSEEQGVVRIARTPAELEEVGRLRYQRFVIDQGQPYRSSSSAALLLVDPIDSLSLNLYVRNADSIAVAMRLSWASDVRPGDYLTLLHAQLGGMLDPGPVVICSRLVAASQMSDLTNFVLLLRRGYEIGLMSGCRRSVLSTHDHRIGLFRRFGYQVTDRVVDDPIAGPQRVLALDLWDVEHLEHVRSPLLPVAKRVLGRTEPRRPRRKRDALMARQG
jgi:hypothetical protein